MYKKRLKYINIIKDNRPTEKEKEIQVNGNRNHYKLNLHYYILVAVSFIILKTKL